MKRKSQAKRTTARDTSRVGRNTSRSLREEADHPRRARAAKRATNGVATRKRAGSTAKAGTRKRTPTPMRKSASATRAGRTNARRKRSQMTQSTL
jgi:hypothetical protein